MRHSGENTHNWAAKDTEVSTTGGIDVLEWRCQNCGMESNTPLSGRCET